MTFALTSGATRLLSGGVVLLSAEEEEEDMPLAINVETASNRSTANTTLTDVDASTALITFTAPASGNVIVRLDGVCQADSAEANGKIGFWGLRESSTDIAGPAATFTQQSTGGANIYNRVSCPFYITGLTPGNSYTYKWAHAATTGATVVVVASSTDPRIMTVWSAP